MLETILPVLTGLFLSGAPNTTSSPCLQLPPVAAPAPAPASTWNGLFVLDRAAGDDLEDVADQVAGQLPRRARGRARDRLKERLRADECLRVSEDSAAVTIESERGVLWRVSRGGTAETGPARGTAARSRSLPASVNDSLIAITGSGERGQGRYELRRRPGDAGVELAVWISAPRLDRPVSYLLVYRPMDEPHAAR